jgi:glycine/D-amino acid oxidase-like deaminating enzyme
VLRGLRVAVLEAGELRGREQDWNASRKEVMELVEAGILSLEEATEQVIGIEFNPVRCGFPGVDDVWLNDVLNVGVRPERLVACARARFEAAGGVVLENTPLTRVSVRPGAAVLSTKGGKVLVRDESGGTATVTIADVKQSNGVVHVVNRVLLPK